MYNFDQPIERQNTKCVKYDGMEHVYRSKDMLPFWIADMDIETPEKIMDAMKQRLNHPVLGYTKWNNECFFKAVKHWYSTRFNTRVMDSDIYFAPSVLFTITEVIRILTKEGEGIIVNMPSYNNFINLIEGNRRIIVESPLKFDGAEYKMDLDHFESLCQQRENKIFLLCNPHNPTGKVFSKTELDEIIEICRAHDVFIIADEIHMDFVRTEAGHQTLVNWMTPDSPLLVTTCLGKTFNISGLSHSFFITRHRYMMMELARRIISVYGLTSVNPLVLEAVNTAYMECDDWVDELNVYIEENMQLVKSFIDEQLSDMLDVHLPEATFLLWIDFSKSGFTEDQVQQALQEVGKVAVGIGSLYELEESTHFRFNVACDRLRLNDGLTRMKKAFDYLRETVQS